MIINKKTYKNLAASLDKLRIAIKVLIMKFSSLKERFADIGTYSESSTI